MILEGILSFAQTSTLELAIGRYHRVAADGCLQIYSTDFGSTFTIRMDIFEGATYSNELGGTSRANSVTELWTQQVNLT
jgi:hypothetical protein